MLLFILSKMWSQIGSYKFGASYIFDRSIAFTSWAGRLSMWPEECGN